MSNDIIFRKVNKDARGPDRVDCEYYNLYALETCTVPALHTAHVRTGVALELCPHGVSLALLPRDGPDGVVEPDYRGEIVVRFDNEAWSEIEIAAGEIIGQIKINKTT